jgi:hypothetical protein
VHVGESRPAEEAKTTSSFSLCLPFVDTGLELYFDNFLEAANGMGVNYWTIVFLANNNSGYKKWKKGTVRRWKCKCDKYLNKFFTARFALVAHEGRQMTR